MRARLFHCVSNGKKAPMSRSLNSNAERKLRQLTPKKGRVLVGNIPPQIITVTGEACKSARFFPRYFVVCFTQKKNNLHYYCCNNHLFQCTSDGESGNLRLKYGATNSRQINGK
jgi:hypothetical protein